MSRLFVVFLMVASVVASTPLVAGSQSVSFYLPYPTGETATQTQGPGGGVSHFYRSTKYAYDFTIASEIWASAPGVIREKTTNVTSQTGAGLGNNVQVEHADGTCTRYAHMTHGSVTSLNVGDAVRQGELLGREGNTGYTLPVGRGHHLHFQREQCSNSTSLAIAFVEGAGRKSQNPGVGATPPTPASPPVLKNPGYEAGVANWAPIFRPSNAVVHRVAYENRPSPREGKWILEANTTVAGASVGQDVSGTIRSGETWYYSVWVRNPSSSGLLDTTIAVYGLGDAGVVASNSSNAKVGQEWQRIDVQLRAPNDGIRTLRVEHYMNTPGRNYNFDNARLGTSGLARVWDGVVVGQDAFLDQSQKQSWDLSKATAGQVGWLRFRLRNIGTTTWVNSGANSTRVGVSEPRNESSAWAMPSWIASNRPGGLQQSSVRPGETGTFLFQIRVPASVGQHYESFELVAEGVAWIGPVIRQGLVVTAAPATTTTTAAPATTTTTAAPATTTTTAAPATTTTTAAPATTTTTAAPATTTTTADVDPLGPEVSDFESFAGSPDLHMGHSIVLRLYWAVLNREPELGGAQFWVETYDVGEWDVRRIAAHFVISKEFQDTYGDLDNASFTSRIYNNMLNRDAEPGGFVFWKGQLDNGMSRAEMVLLVSNSPEFIARRPLPSDARVDTGPRSDR